MNFEEGLRESFRAVVREELQRFFAERQPASAPAAAPIELLDVDDVVTYCSSKVTASRVRSWCRSGRLVAKKEGRGYLIERAALVRFLSTIQPAKEPAAEKVENEITRLMGRARGAR